MRKANPQVLIATDFSPGSQAALRAVPRLWPAGTRLRLHLVHVLEPLVAAAGPTAYWARYEQDRTAQARRALRRAADRLTNRLGPGVSVRTHLPIGPVHAEICKLAARLKADLVVVGTHGRTGLGHVLIGSVAERVVRHARRPVLTIPLVTRRARRS